MGILTIVGIGPGSAGYLMPIAKEKMNQAACVIAAKRILPMLEEACQQSEGEVGSQALESADGIAVQEKVQNGEQSKFKTMTKIKDTFFDINEILKIDKDVVLVVSGDPLMYSLYKTIQHDPISSEWKIEIIPGIGSLQMLGAAFGETMEDAAFVSVHGRAKTEGSVALCVTENPKVFFLCSKEQGPAWLSRIMLEYDLCDVTVFAGANLSYEDEILIKGTPQEMVDKEFPSLCVAMIKNPHPRQVTRPCFLSDEDFERGKTPMTKEEIRVLILHKMKLHPDDVVWDIGAGTGSISIECARQVPFGQVHAVERYEEAVTLIQKNKEKFSADNLSIYQGVALERIHELPVPNKVFIGGSGGQLDEIIKIISELPQKIQVTISAVTIETIAEANEILSKYDTDFDVIQATVGRGRKIGSYHIVDTNNPVMIFTATI